MNEFSEYAADFKDDFPEFSGNENFTDEKIEEALGITEFFIGPRWGEYKKYSVMRQGWFNRAAHTLFMSEKARQDAVNNKVPGSTRGVDSATVADESTVFGSQIMLKLKPWEDELSSTYYGVRYLELRDQVGLVGFFA